MKIYIDVLIVTNILLNMIFIECTARLTHTKLSKKRTAAASLIGGISSLLVVLSAENMAEGVLLTALKLASIYMIILVSFGARDMRASIKYFFIYIVVNAVFIGVCILFWRFGSGRVVYFNTLTVYLDISLIKLMTGATVTYIALALYEYMQRKSFDINKSFHILIRMENLEYYLPAIADTGNSLTDAFTGKPVIIIISDELYYHFELDREEIALKTGFHCIPYSTINGDSIINVTDNARVTIIDSAMKQKSIDCAVGILSCNKNKPRAIFNPSIIA
ncbi:MAG: sigma-E processing peptidase SpoIIGA [Ruminococcus sp.]|nr:sigma-E processing peptidase SpoIIGA [Ruminococcus sp.]